MDLEGVMEDYQIEFILITQNGTLQGTGCNPAETLSMAFKAFLQAYATLTLLKALQSKM